MTKTALYEALNDFFQSLDDADLVAIHNEYCDDTQHYDDRIYSMDEFDEIWDGQDALFVAQRVFFGSDEGREESSFNPCRDWFYLNGYGNPVSMDYVGYNQYSNEYMCGCIDVDDIIDYIIDNDYDYNYTEIREILEENA